MICATDYNIHSFSSCIHFKQLYSASSSGATQRRTSTSGREGKPHADKSGQGGRKTGIFADVFYGRPLMDFISNVPGCSFPQSAVSLNEELSTCVFSLRLFAEDYMG